MSERAPIPKQAAAEVLEWMDEMSDPYAVSLAISQALEAGEKALNMGGCEAAANHAYCRRFLESLARGNADLLRALEVKQ